MLKKITIHHLLAFLLLASAFALASAYISQYVFDYQPCILCYYQRKPFFAIIALAIAGLLVRREKHKKLVLLVCLAFLTANAGIAAYHTGVEQKIFKGPSTCENIGLAEITNIEELKIALQQSKAVRCDEPQFFFLGLTMAAWNIVYCLGLVILTLFFLRNRN